MFVMELLEGQEIFGTPTLAGAWWQAILKHPLAYLQHRTTFQWAFLFDTNLALWSRDLNDPDKIAYEDNARLMAVKAVNDALNPTPLFRPGTWLLLNVALCASAWRRRDTPTGAFILGICGSAVVYVMTFFSVGVSTDLRYAYWAVLAGLVGGVATALKRPKIELFVKQQVPMAA